MSEAQPEFAQDGHKEMRFSKSLRPRQIGSVAAAGNGGDGFFVWGAAGSTPMFIVSIRGGVLDNRRNLLKAARIGAGPP